jgi:hypothetical protein
MGSVFKRVSGRRFDKLGPLCVTGPAAILRQEQENMEWLIVALREPLVELAELGVLAALAAVTARLRVKQRRAHDQLRKGGQLPPRGQYASLLKRPRT